MKTVSIRLDDSVYEALGDVLDSMGQTKQTFYETYTRTVIREGCIPFLIKSSKTLNSDNKVGAFEKLESVRMKKHDSVSYNQELEAAIDEKYGHIN